MLYEKMNIKLLLKDNPNAHTHLIAQTKCDISTPMGKYSVIKRNKVLMHTTAWMNLRSIVVSERSQTQKTMQSVISRT